MQCLRLAGYKLLLKGHRMENLFEAFGSFAVFEEPDDGFPPDLSAEIIVDHDYSAHLMPDALYSQSIGSAIFLQNRERLVFINDGSPFTCVEFNSDYASARYYFDVRRYRDLAANKNQVDFTLYTELRRQLAAYLFCHRELMLHSVSVLYRGEAFAISAPSETGKSTHAQYWVEGFGAKVINGDCNACRIRDEGVYLYGLPWCGNSRIYHNEHAPLRAVVFLERGDGNEVRRLSPSESITRLTARSYLPRWDALLMSGDYLMPAERLTAKTPCYALRCKPDKEAAEVLRQCLYPVRP